MGLDNDDKPFTEVSVPVEFVEAWIRDLSLWEIHAMLLGGVGVYVGPALRVELVYPTAISIVLLLGVAFKFHAILDLFGRSIATRTVSREPWYFSTVYVTLSVVSWVLYPVFV